MEVVTLLLDLQAQACDWGGDSVSGYTPLHFAAAGQYQYRHHHHTSCCLHLCCITSVLTPPSSQHETAAGHISVVQAIICRETVSWSTPSPSQSSQSLVHMTRRVRVLLLRDLRGRTAEDEARRAGHTEVALLIAAAVAAIYPRASRQGQGQGDPQADAGGSGSGDMLMPPVEIDDEGDRENYLLATA